jgi:hypothetical protein
MTKRPLGTQVTIRLEPEMADRLREVAQRTGGLYTVMLREWIEQRLVRETTPVVSQPPDIQVAGQGGYPQIQVTGAGRLVRD